MGCCLFGLVEGLLEITGFILVGLFQVTAFILVGLCKIIAFLLVALGNFLVALSKAAFAAIALAIASIIAWRATRKEKIVIHKNVSAWKEWEPVDDK